MPHTIQTKEERMQRILEVWLNNPFDSYEKIAEKAGISEITFYRYRKNPEFMAEYHNRQKERFSALEGKAMAQLENKLDEGEWKAIQYTLDGLGYKAAEKIEADVNTSYTVGFKDGD